MPGISDILGLGADAVEMADTAVLPTLTQAWLSQEQEKRLNSQAMMAAGLGMLAGNKGNYGAAGPAIGAGLGVGLETYQNAKQLQEAQAIKLAQLRANALKERELTEYRKQQIELGRRRELDAAESKRMQLEQQREQGVWRHEDTMARTDEQKLAHEEAAAARLSTHADAEANRRTQLGIEAGRLAETKRHDLESEAAQGLHEFEDKETGEVVVLNEKTGKVTSSGHQAQAKQGAQKYVTSLLDGKSTLFRVNPDGTTTPLMYKGKPMEAPPKGGKDPEEHLLDLYNKEIRANATALDFDEWKAQRVAKQGNGSSEFKPSLPEGWTVVTN